MGKHRADSVSAIKWNERLIRNLRTNPDENWTAAQRMDEIELAQQEILALEDTITDDCRKIWNLSNNRFTTTNSMMAV